MSDKGWESLSYQFEIRGGDYSGRSEFTTFQTLTGGTVRTLTGQLNITVKFFIKALVLATGDNMQGNEGGKALEEALQRKAVGSYYNLIITVTKIEMAVSSKL